MSKTKKCTSGRCGSGGLLKRGPSKGLRPVPQPPSQQEILHIEWDIPVCGPNNVCVGLFVELMALLGATDAKLTEYLACMEGQIEV